MVLNRFIAHLRGLTGTLPSLDAKGVKGETHKVPLDTQHLPLRQVKFRSTDALRRAQLIWHCLLVSLPFDLLLFDLVTRIDPRPQLFQIAPTFSHFLLALTVGITFFIIIDLSALYLKLKKFQSWLAIARLSKLYWIFAILLMSIPVIELFIRLIRINGSTGLILALTIALLGMVGIWRESHSEKSELHQRTEDPIVWVETANRELFILSLFPLLLARALSAQAVLHYGVVTNNSYSFSLCFIGSLLLLIHFKPNRSTYISHCPRCSILTSIVLKEIGSCPACDRQHFLKEGAEPLNPASNEKEEGANPPNKKGRGCKKYLLSLIKFRFRRVKENNI